jgi:selenocysteine lyase/cysteine desulfurase
LVQLPSQRHLFEIPDDVTYLNCAYMAPLMRSVAEAGILGIRRKSSPWKITAEQFFDEVDRARELFARLIGGDGDGVALIPAASYGLATAAANVPVGPGDRIVLLAEQFPSNVLVWRDLAARTGAEIFTVARPDDGDWTAALDAGVDERTRVVAVPNCHWTDGSVLDIVQAGRLARSVDASLVVDATQSLGAVPFDVAEVRPDALVAAGYKWLLGPYSLGFAWFAPQWREGRPLEYSWMTRRESVDFAHLVDYRDEFREGARRFDVGETANFALMPMAIEALGRVLDWGIPEISLSLRALTEHLAEEASRIGLDVPPSNARAPHMIGLTLPEAAPSDLPERLAAADVYVSVRGDSIRVSPHLYNDSADIKRLIESLAAL